MGADLWAEPIEQPADRDTLEQYDVDPKVLTRWRKAATSTWQHARRWSARPSARAGGRQHAPPATGHVDIVITGPPGPDAPRFIEIADDQGRSIQYGEWIKREWLDHEEGLWVLRIPR